MTVKFRKGWDSGNVNAVAFAQMCQQAGAGISISENMDCFYQVVIIE